MSKDAIYVANALNEWPSVAERIYEQKDIEPQYWVTLGLHPQRWEDRSKQNIKAKFPNAIVHNPTHAMYGRSPGEYDFENWVTLDSGLLSEFNHYEAMTLQMMERMDTYKQSLERFSYDRRIRLYYRQLSYWIGVVEDIEPDIVIFSSTPHLIFDYILYAVCDYLNIETIIYTSINLPNRFTVRKCIDENLIDDSDGKHANAEPSRINKRYLKDLRSDYSNAKPKYLESKEIDSASYLQKLQYFTNSLYELTTKRDQNQKFMNDARRYIYNYPPLVRKILRYILPRYHKYKLSSKYKSVSSSPTFSSSKYIYFPLHYQPERTTSPEGGRYVHQHLAIKMLASTTPSEISIFVKEHPSQFRSNLQGELGRSATDYYDLNSISGVKIISMDSNPFELIDNSEAVATVTGTAGWEALVRGTPSLVFGNAWYRSASGCYYVKTNSQLKEAIKNIQENNHISRKKINDFVVKVESKTYVRKTNADQGSKVEAIYNSFCENI